MNYFHSMRGIIIYGGRDNKTNYALNNVYFLNLEFFEWLGVLMVGTSIEPRYGHVTFI